jgi:ABC-2 type transport system permease protein
MKMTKFKYNNLVKTIALTDFRLKYQGSILGYLWSLVKPLMLFSIYYFVFTRVFRLGGAIPYYPVYLLLGIVVWSYFQETTVSCLLSIVSKGELIRKVYFPRIILIVSASLTSFLTFALNFLIVSLFAIVTKVPFSARLLLSPLVLFELFVFIVGIGLFLASIYVKFRDVSHIWEIIMQALFYATPILYSPQMLPGITKQIAMLNPLAQILQDLRFLLITTETATAWKILPFPFSIIPYVLPFVIFIIGYSLFEKMAARFAEDV